MIWNVAGTRVELKEKDTGEVVLITPKGESVLTLTSGVPRKIALLDLKESTIPVKDANDEYTLQTYKVSRQWHLGIGWIRLLKIAGNYHWDMNKGAEVWVAPMLFYFSLPFCWFDCKSNPWSEADAQAHYFRLDNPDGSKIEYLRSSWATHVWRYTDQTERIISQTNVAEDIFGAYRTFGEERAQATLAIKDGISFTYQNHQITKVDVERVHLLESIFPPSVKLTDEKWRATLITKFTRQSCCGKFGHAELILEGLENGLPVIRLIHLTKEDKKPAKSQVLYFSTKKPPTYDLRRESLTISKKQANDCMRLFSRIGNRDIPFDYRGAAVTGKHNCITWLFQFMNICGSSISLEHMNDRAYTTPAECTPISNRTSA